MTINKDTGRGPLNILITGGRAPVALELARLLHRAGHQVYAADSISRYLCRASAAVKEAAILPPPRQQPQAFLEALEALLVRWQIDLLIPTCEEIFHIARGREQLQRHCRVLSPELGMLHQLHHKGEFIRLADQLGFRIPHTELITNEQAWRSAETLGMCWSDSKRKTGENCGTEDIGDQCGTASSKVVFKPAYSRFASRVILPSFAGSKQTRRVDQGLRKAAWKELSPSSPWIVQEYIQGTAWCTYSVAYEGTLLAHATYACRYRTGEAGVSVHFQQTQHPKAHAWVERFVSGLGFSGQISFDFIQAEDGTLYPIECNPRATSGVHLFTAEDGFAAALTDPDQLLREGCTVTPTPGTAAMISLAMLGCGLRDNRSRQDWHAWTSAMRGAHDVIWHKGDCTPFLEQLCMVYQAWRLSRQLGMSVTAALTQDIEWNGET